MITAARLATLAVLARVQADIDPAASSVSLGVLQFITITAAIAAAVTFLAALIRWDNR